MIGHGVPGIDIRQEHDFSASAAVLFAALTIGLDAWWPAEARVLGADSRISLTADLGAYLIESNDDGHRIMLAQVEAIAPDRRLSFNGWFGIAGIVAGRVQFDLTDREDGTRLTLVHQAIGPVPEDQVNRRSRLWRQILDQSLRRYVGNTPA